MPERCPGIAPRDCLLVPWKLAAGAPGVVYADVDDGPAPVIGEFVDHVLAADAVCAHNAVLNARPRV